MLPFALVKMQQASNYTKQRKEPIEPAKAVSLIQAILFNKPKRFKELIGETPELDYVCIISQKHPYSEGAIATNPKDIPLKSAQWAETPLHFAVRYQRYEFADKICRSKANVNSTDSFELDEVHATLIEITALDIAANKQDIKMQRILASYGALQREEIEEILEIFDPLRVGKREKILAIFGMFREEERQKILRCFKTLPDEQKDKILKWIAMWQENDTRGPLERLGNEERTKILDSFDGLRASQRREMLESFLAPQIRFGKVMQRSDILRIKRIGKMLKRLDGLWEKEREEIWERSGTVRDEELQEYGESMTCYNAKR